MPDIPPEDRPTETETSVKNTADGTLAGQVTDSDGDPIQRAEVRIFDYSTGDRDGFDRTDANGNYSESVPPDDYDVLVEKAGYEAGEATNVTVSSNTTTRVDFSLDPAFRKVVGKTADTYGIGVLGRNTTSSGWQYGVKGVVESTDSRSAGLRGYAPNGGRGVGPYAEEEDAIVGFSRWDDGIRGITEATDADGISGISRANNGNGNGVVGLTNSEDGQAAGVDGIAFALSGTATGVRGVTGSDEGYGVFFF